MHNFNIVKKSVWIVKKYKKNTNFFCNRFLQKKQTWILFLSENFTLLYSLFLSVLFFDNNLLTNASILKLKEIFRL